MKILIVERNRILANIIALKIQNMLGYESDIANSYESAKKFAKNEYYLLAIIDLNISDNDHDLIKYLYNLNIKSIVMSFTKEEINYRHIRDRDIIDFILKDRSESIDYMISIIKRVSKNKNLTVLIADKDQKCLNDIKSKLKNQLLNVITTNDGIEAIEYIRKKRDIKLVLISYDLVSENGIELVIALRKTYSKDELPIFGLIDDNIISSIFIKYGINDFIKKPIIKDELIIRVNNILNSHENLEKLTKYANTDYMTQIANRKHFYQTIGIYYKKAKAQQIPFAIAMIDIDYFKYINDTYGHSIGDMVIKKVASLIKENIKGQDMVARFGGEEFCVALKNIDKNHAHKFLESIRKKISELRFYIGDNVKVSFTVSIGVCTDYKNSLEEMVKESDRYLYFAKEEGRNRVCSNLSHLYQSHKEEALT